VKRQRKYANFYKSPYGYKIPLSLSLSVCMYIQYMSNPSVLYVGATIKEAKPISTYCNPRRELGAVTLHLQKNGKHTHTKRN
jgi:hypothetical protein